HQTFAWVSEAPGMAHVHCVIVGFDKRRTPPQVLYTYADPKVTPTATPAENINPYLLDAPHLFVEKRSTPLSPSIPLVTYGSKPTDGGNLLIDDQQEYADVMADPVAAKYVRRFVGARELIHNIPRWCLWLEGLDPGDVHKSMVLKRRLEASRDFRLNSKQIATQEAAGSPHLSVERRQPSVPYLRIPAHFSETRRYATVAHLNSHVICGSGNLTAEDPDGLLFGLISSSMFLS